MRTERTKKPECRPFPPKIPVGRDRILIPTKGIILISAVLHHHLQKKRGRHFEEEERTLGQMHPLHTDLTLECGRQGFLSGIDGPVWWCCVFSFWGTELGTFLLAPSLPGTIFLPLARALPSLEITSCSPKRIVGNFLPPHMSHGECTGPEVAVRQREEGSHVAEVIRT